MPRRLQATVLAVLGLCAAGGCAAQREPVVAIEPIYSVVRDGGPVVDGRDAPQTAPGPVLPLRLLIADAEPGL